MIQVNKHWCLLTYQVENCLFSHDLFILVRTLVNKERSKRSMIFCISCICQAFNLSSVCVSLLLDIGWFKCLRAQNGVCSSVGGKEGVLWVMFLTNGWEGLVYVFPSFLSLMHVPAYQQFGSFIVILITIVRQVRQPGWNTRKCYICSTTVVHAVAQLVEALRYKPKGCGFDSQRCHWNFSLT